VLLAQRKYTTVKVKRRNNMTQKYDGLYFLPSDEEDGLKIAFFDLVEPMKSGTPIEGNAIGDKFHIAFFKEGEDGTPIFDESFEAIFADPVTYISQMAGMNLYGCMLRKTDKSTKWFNDYLTKAMNHVTIASLND
jgi:hypothetical protein